MTKPVNRDLLSDGRVAEKTQQTVELEISWQLCTKIESELELAVLDAEEQVWRTLRFRVET